MIANSVAIQITGLTVRSLGPAVKVPGLVFLAGQTATGEIKQATVSLRFSVPLYSC